MSTWVKKGDSPFHTNFKNVNNVISLNHREKKKLFLIIILKTLFHS